MDSSSAKVGQDGYPRRHFYNVFTREDFDDLYTLKESTHPDMPEITVSENGVYKLLLNRNPRKAAGPDVYPVTFTRRSRKNLHQS